MKKIFIVMLLSLTMTVTAFALESVEKDLGTIVVTASRIAQSDYKIAGNVTVITSQQIKASNAQNVPDVLKQALGVNVTDNNTPKSSVVDIRGFGDTAGRNVLVLVNDRKINNADISGPDLIQIPIESVERIEIIRGAGSVLYGDNAVGGVINIITKKGKGKLSARTGFTYGSYDAQSSDVELSGEKNNVSYYMHSKYNDARGYRDNSDLLAKDYNGRFSYDFEKKINADLNIGYHQDTQELPGGLTDADINTVGRRGSVNDQDVSYTKDRYVSLSLSAKPWPKDLYYGELVIEPSYRLRDVYDSFNSFGAYNTKRSIDTLGIVGKYIFNQTVFDKQVNFVTGIDYYDTNNDILGSGSNVDDITITKKEFGVYGSLEYEIIPNVFANIGNRYQRADYHFDQRNVLVNQSVTPDEDVWTGGAKYEYMPGSNIFFNIQQTFRFLATDEWYSTANFPGFGISPGLNTDLKQQTGVQYEAGIKHNFNDKVVFSVTPYLMNLKNEIFFDPVTFANSNYGKTQRMGVEIGTKVDVKKFIDVDLLNKLEIFTNFTYQNPQFVNGSNDGKDIPMVPREQLNAGIVTGFLKYYNLALTSRFVGSRYAINDTLNATQRVEPYCVFDSKLSFKKDFYEIFFAVNNIFNQFYSNYVVKSAFSSTKQYFPEPERNFNVGVNLKF